MYLWIRLHIYIYICVCMCNKVDCCGQWKITVLSLFRNCIIHIQARIIGCVACSKKKKKSSNDQRSQNERKKKEPCYKVKLYIHVIFFLVKERNWKTKGKVNNCMYSPTWCKNAWRVANKAHHVIIWILSSFLSLSFFYVTKVELW